MGTIRSTTGQVVSTQNAPSAQRVVLGAAAAYNWGTAAATLGQRPKIIVYPAAGAPDVLTMPAENLCAGWEVLIDNTGAGTLQVNNDGGGNILTTAIAAAATSRLYCDGLAWLDLGEAPAT